MTADASGPVADLHVHTTVSDGTLTLGEIPTLARERGLDAVAVTDHDRIHPGFSRPIFRRNGVWLVRGIELKVERETGQRIDLLGYGLRETEALRRITDRIQENRPVRARAMIERLEERLGVELDVSLERGVGRPHVARAVARHPETEYTVTEVFAELIGDDGPCYVARWVPSFAEGSAALREACAIVGVAHPLRYADVDGAIAAARELGAIERWYPYDESTDLAPVDAAIAEADLVATGGSDAHDRHIGVTGPDRTAFDRFALACGIQ